MIDHGILIIIYSIFFKITKIINLGLVYNDDSCET